jgi:flagella basal body P-ring formation protein FlgA
MLQKIFIIWVFFMGIALLQAQAALAKSDDSCGHTAYSIEDVREVIETHLLNALQRGYTEERVIVSIDGESSWFAPENGAASFCFEMRDMLQKNRHYNAYVRWIAEEDGAARIQKVTGKYTHSAEVPVFSTKPERGEMIGAHHLMMKRVPVETIQSNTLTQIEDVLGKIIKQGAFLQTPITEGQLSKPFLVTKGLPVVVVYQQGTLLIKTDGVALDSAAKGQVVRVRNLRSNVIINGIVKDSGVVMMRNASRAHIAPLFSGEAQNE